MTYEWPDPTGEALIPLPTLTEDDARAARALFQGSRVNWPRRTHTALVSAIEAELDRLDTQPVPDVDRHIWLCGMEDGEVEVKCRTCDTGGRPVALYLHPDDWNPYGPEMPTTYSVLDLYRLAREHVVTHHSES